MATPASPRSPPARSRLGGRAAGRQVGFSQSSPPLPRTSGREHLPLAFVSGPRPASHPSAAARGPRPSVRGSRRPRPRPPAGSIPTRRAQEAGGPSAPRGGSCRQPAPRGGSPSFRQVRAPTKAGVRRLSPPAHPEITAGAAEMKGAQAPRLFAKLSLLPSRQPWTPGVSRATLHLQPPTFNWTGPSAWKCLFPFLFA